MDLAMGFPLIFTENPLTTEEAEFCKAVDFLLCCLERGLFSTMTRNTTKREKHNSGETNVSRCVIHEPPQFVNGKRNELFWQNEGWKLPSSHGGPKTGTPEMGRVDLTTLVQRCHASRTWLCR